MKSRLNWRPEEDKMLKELRDQQKIGSWHQIAERLTTHFSSSNRSAKQCRERYSNTARFYGENQEKKTWNSEQDELLYFCTHKVDQNGVYFQNLSHQNLKIAQKIDSIAVQGRQPENQYKHRKKLEDQEGDQQHFNLF